MHKKSRIESSLLRRRISQLVLTVCAALACGQLGCSDDDIPAPASKPAAKKEPAPEKKAAALEETKPPEPEWSYSPVGKRDPFRSYLSELEVGQADEEGPPSPTRAYQLDQYRLTGVITGTAQPRAMVEDPEGVGHVLKIGDRLGKRGGRLTRIRSTGIVVTELIRSPTGQAVRVPISIDLPRPELAIELDD